MSVVGLRRGSSRREASSRRKPTGGGGGSFRDEEDRHRPAPPDIGGRPAHGRQSETVGSALQPPCGDGATDLDAFEGARAARTFERTAVRKRDRGGARKHTPPPVRRGLPTSRRRSGRTGPGDRREDSYGSTRSFGGTMTRHFGDDGRSIHRRPTTGGRRHCPPTFRNCSSVHHL